MLSYAHPHFIVSHFSRFPPSPWKIFEQRNSLATRREKIYTNWNALIGKKYNEGKKIKKKKKKNTNHCPRGIVEKKKKITLRSSLKMKISSSSFERCNHLGTSGDRVYGDHLCCGSILGHGHLVISRCCLIAPSKKHSFSFHANSHEPVENTRSSK